MQVLDHGYVEYVEHWGVRADCQVLPTYLGAVLRGEEDDMTKAVKKAGKK